MMKSVFPISILVLGLVLSPVLGPVLELSAANAQEQAKNSEETPTPPAILNLERDDALAHFCRNIETQAEAARFELQMRRLDAKKLEINERIELLEQKRSEYESWLKKRDDFLEKTQNSLITIMAKMKPAAAAEQLALSDDMVAASLLLKLKPAQASAIMNELPAEKAANLTHILASAQKLPPKPLSEKAPQKEQN